MIKIGKNLIKFITKQLQNFIRRPVSLDGFSLLELLITVAIIGILAGISYPLYTSHLTRVRRSQAEVTLTHLAARLEQYYLEHNSYKEATLANLAIKEYPKNGFYQLKIDEVKEHSYQISAIPQGAQAQNDQKCGTLMLDQSGEKKVSGVGSVSECWR